MKAKKVHETYFIEGRDSDELIPKETQAVLINYDGDGNVDIFSIIP